MISIRSLLVVGFLVFVCNSVFAAGTYFDGLQITRLSINSNMAYFSPVGTALNPDACGSYEKALLPDTHPNFNHVYSLLMSAQLTGKPVRVFVTGCYSGWGSTYPQVETVHLLD